MLVADNTVQLLEGSTGSGSNAVWQSMQADPNLMG